MKPEAIERLMGKSPPEAALHRKQKEERGSAPDKQDAAVDEKWTDVQKPDMSTDGEWMDIDVRTQPASSGNGAVDMCSDPLNIALTLRKALNLQWAALGEGSVLKKKGQEKQVLDQLKKIESNAQQFIASIESWKATAKDVLIDFKDLRDGHRK